VYIAQKSGATGGSIYTCATSAAPLPLDGNLYSACNNKLVVNGIFSANQILLMRTVGSVGQANAGETAGSNNAAEVFNYSPAMWLAQPPGGSTTGSSNYDSITSLPPIL
jgi:hypothetical protein